MVTRTGMRALLPHSPPACHTASQHKRLRGPLLGPGSCLRPPPGCYLWAIDAPGMPPGCYLWDIDNIWAWDLRPMPRQ